MLDFKNYVAELKTIIIPIAIVEVSRVMGRKKVAHQVPVRCYCYHHTL